STGKRKHWKRKTPEELSEIGKKISESNIRAKEFTPIETRKRMSDSAITRHLVMSEEDKKKLNTKQSSAWDRKSKESLLKLSLVKSDSAKRQHSTMSEEAKLERSRKISESIKKVHANRTEAERNTINSKISKSKKISK
ncbi:MAG: hypothetical protein NTW30_05065, partial [Candidatus Aenigmarchaeota archaeon]|nr:hypothetical protein [Candidatus Aenigmarchaeota archaeon]